MRRGGGEVAAAEATRRGRTTPSSWFARGHSPTERPPPLPALRVRGGGGRKGRGCGGGGDERREGTRGNNPKRLPPTRPRVQGRPRRHGGLRAEGDARKEGRHTRLLSSFPFRLPAVHVRRGGGRKEGRGLCAGGDVRPRRTRVRPRCTSLHARAQRSLLALISHCVRVRPRRTLWARD